jgi:hypothetical protein
MIVDGDISDSNALQYSRVLASAWQIQKGRLRGGKRNGGNQDGNDQNGQQDKSTHRFLP